MESAFEQQKKSIRSAESIFHDTLKNLKSAYKEKVHSAIKADKRGDAQVLTDTLNQLSRVQAYYFMHMGISAAEDAVLLAFYLS